MSNKTAFWCIVALLVAMAVVTVAVYNRLPAVMVTHWDVGAKSNSTMPRLWGAVLPVLIAAGTAVLLWILPLIDPKRRNYAAFRSTYNLFVVGIVAFLTYLDFLTIAWNLGYHPPINQAIAPAVGALLALSGLLLYNARPNWFVGIRTPWTLSSVSVWERTHRLAAPAFIFSGVVAAAGIFWAPLLWVGLVLAMLTVALVVVYSFFAYEKEQRQAL